FSQLIQSIDESHRTMDKIAAIQRYFTSVPAEDAAWAVFFFNWQEIPTGHKNPVIAPMGGRSFRSTNVADG
ncbi:MAG: hypothetical protein LR011_03315, partial [Verrucomicrobia bacterium]|nr:hypothetical protein [Verrucomicrobiota bacterium]